MNGHLSRERALTRIIDVTIPKDKGEGGSPTTRTWSRVKAGRPTLDNDGRYGSPEAFIDAVFRDVSR